MLDYKVISSTVRLTCIFYTNIATFVHIIHNNQTRLLVIRYFTVAKFRPKQFDQSSRQFSLDCKNSGLSVEETVLN